MRCNYLLHFNSWTRAFRRFSEQLEHDLQPGALPTSSLRLTDSFGFIWRYAELGRG